MHILVVGQGGREHAMVKALLTAHPAPKLWIAPGNAGTARYGQNVPIQATDCSRLLAFAKQEHIDLVIIGPEAALVAGLADLLIQHGIAVCGPSMAAAQLEASKCYTRQLGQQLALPAPNFCIINDAKALHDVLAYWKGLPPVLKADGLANGKGVYLPSTLAECQHLGESLLQGQLGQAGTTFLLEERLQGIEASLFFACDKNLAVALPHAQDYKRLADFDAGPNTGGMGAISPNPHISNALEQDVLTRLVQPTLQYLQTMGTPFCGFLYVGVMLTQDGAKLIEFNVRLGDPETQVILPRLADGEFLNLAWAMAHGQLTDRPVHMLPHSTCAIVLSSQGYPDNPELGAQICVDPLIEDSNRWLMHAGTTMQDSTLQVAGGRVGCVVAQGADLQAAREHAYAGLIYIQFAGMHHRNDIGQVGLKT